MFTLQYDLGRYDDKTIYEDFDTVEELMERYKEIEWDYCEFKAWDDETEIKPWFWNQFK